MIVWHSTKHVVRQKENSTNLELSLQPFLVGLTQIHNYWTSWAKLWYQTGLVQLSILELCFSYRGFPQLANIRITTQTNNSPRQVLYFAIIWPKIKLNNLMLSVLLKFVACSFQFPFFLHLIGFKIQINFTLRHVWQIITSNQPFRWLTSLQLIRWKAETRSPIICWF